MALIILFSPGRRTRLLAGFGAAVAVLLALTVVTSGMQSLGWWLKALVGYSSYVKETPAVTSVSGLYVRWASDSLREALEVVSGAIALALTGWWWWKYRSARQIPMVAVGWLWLVWLLATPYAHYYDEPFLTVPILALMGRDGWRVSWKLPATALYMMFLSLLVLYWVPHQVQLLCLPLLVVALCCWLAARNPAYPEAAGMRATEQP